MSDVQPFGSAASAATPSRAPFNQRPRHSRDGPDPAGEPEEEKQGAAHVSPVARLYRHAIESVFGFLSLRDLGRVLSVSRSWSSAVRSMKSISATLVKPRSCALVVASPLARHIGQVGSVAWWKGLELTSTDLLLFSHHLGSLTVLACSVRLPQPSRLVFGHSLHTLNLQLKGDAGNVSAINDAIVAVSQLPQLTDLMLDLFKFFPALSFAPLEAASKLRDLEFDTEVWSQPTPEHLDQLRMLPHLCKMAIVRLSSANLLYLLRAPHLLQWHEIHRVDGIGDDLAGALCTLPTLTELEARHCLSVAFLPSLTRLRSLDLHLDLASVHAAEAIVTGLSHCTQLTELALRADYVTSRHMSQALSHLPLLRSLTLWDCPALESLSFLSDCACLTQSLQSLRLSCCNNAALHSTEIKHILTLKSLVSLVIKRTFVEPLDACTKDLLTPPSVVLPKLETFEY